MKRLPEIIDLVNDVDNVPLNLVEIIDDNSEDENLSGHVDCTTQTHGFIDLVATVKSVSTHAEVKSNNNAKTVL